MNWYILNCRSGRELFLHELFVKAGYQVYTPFERLYQRQVSRKARKERKPPEVYAEALFRGYLFVGSDKDVGQALLGIAYIIDRRDDAYSFMVDRGEPFVLSGPMMQRWRETLLQAHSGRKNYVTRGYDPRRDARKNRRRLYGQQVVTIPHFTVGEQVKFLTGGFQGLGAEITKVGSESVSVLMTIFGSKREMHDIDVYELQKSA